MPLKITLEACWMETLIFKEQDMVVCFKELPPIWSEFLSFFTACLILRRVTARRTTSSGIHIRSDDDEKIFFSSTRGFRSCLGYCWEGWTFQFRCPFFVASSFAPPPPPPPPALRVALKTYRTVAGPPSPRPSDKKRKKKSRREQKQPIYRLLFFASRTNWKIYVVRRGADAKLKFFLGVWMRVGNYETSEETASCHLTW